MEVEHIDYALVAKTHTPMYLMHKYWARKPHNVVAEYIKHYSKKGEIVLDPFAGSGVTAIEAIKLNRKAIAIDLDPMATFITRMTAIPVDLNKFKEEFEKIKEKIKPKIDELFKTKCEKCKKYVISTHIIWEYDESSKKGKPLEIWYRCPNCNHKKTNLLKKTPDKDDLNRLEEIDKITINYWYPKNELIWNTRVNVNKGEKVFQLFTKRNLYSLSMLLNEIEKIENQSIKNLMKFTFTSSLAQASRLIPVVKGGRECKSWTIRGYWIPPKHFEINTWNCFKERFIKIFRGKTESNDLIKHYKEANISDDFNNESNILIKTYNTLELDNLLKPNSIDYIFTDPPYGDAVPYLELDYMWNSWLNFKPEFEDEIVVSDSPIREKNDEIYQRMLNAAFKKIFNVLKPGRWMTVTFHNTQIKYWNSILSACIYAGFELEKIIYQPAPRASAKSLLHPYGSAVGDYYIRFRKPKMAKLRSESQIDESRYEKIILESAKRIIAERGEPTPYTYILNGIIVELKKEGALLIGKMNPDEVMKKYLNSEFILVESKDEKGKIIGKKWWFKDPNKISYLELVPLSDRIEIAVVDVLRRKIKVSFDDVLQEIFIKFPNALTPETQSINEILKEYAHPTKDKKWMLKPEVKVRESEHNKIIYFLGILGKKAGLDVWVGSKEQSEVFNNIKLSNLVTKKEPIFRFIPSMNVDRIKQIDVIWHDEGRIKYELEIENTTAITEAIVRGSNIPHDDIIRIIVIPKEREALLSRKMKDPILQENIEKYDWKFTFYDDIEKLFKKYKSKKEFDTKELKNILKIPKPTRITQNSIKHYFEE